MFDSDGGPHGEATPAPTPSGPALARLSSAIDALLDMDLGGCSDDDVLAILRGLERQRRRLAALDHGLIGQVERRGLAHRHAFRSTTDLLVGVLRLEPGEASGRVRAAAVLGPRVAVSGAPLPPLLPSTAAAQADGVISAAHARVIASTIEALPAAVSAEHAGAIDVFLAEQARAYNPRTVRLLARRLHDTLDPDGILATAADRHRRRDLTVQQRPDGSSCLRGELDAICTEALLTVIDTLGRPRPATQPVDTDEAPPVHDTARGDAGKDLRTAGQRRHDGLRDGLLALLRSGELPACGGVAATIVLTTTPDELATGTGLARTGHGALLPTSEAKTLLGDAQVQVTAVRSMKGIDAYSHTHRIFTVGQRLAMIARDLGCTFPGCTAPPAWCEAHHVTDWALTRRTSVDDGTLLCGYHHREHPALGWTCRMIDGIPSWVPPPWIDPTRTPRQNSAHDPVDAALREASTELVPP